MHLGKDDDVCICSAQLNMLPVFVCLLVVSLVVSALICTCCTFIIVCKGEGINKQQEIRWRDGGRGGGGWGRAASFRIVDYTSVLDPVHCNRS